MEFSGISETLPFVKYEEDLEMTTLLCLRVRTDHLNLQRLACWHSIEHVFQMVMTIPPRRGLWKVSVFWQN